MQQKTEAVSFDDSLAGDSQVYEGMVLSNCHLFMIFFDTNFLFAYLQTIFDQLLLWLS